MNGMPEPCEGRNSTMIDRVGRQVIPANCIGSECFASIANLAKFDRVVTRNGKCVYECVWIESNTPGVWFCAYALDLYGWVHLGDVDRFGRRGCVGNYIRADDGAPPEGTKGDRHPDDCKPDHELDPFPPD